LPMIFGMSNPSMRRGTMAYPMRASADARTRASSFVGRDATVRMTDDGDDRSPREALCDAFSDYVDELLYVSSGVPEPTWSLASLPLLVEGFYRTLALRDRHARAYVMLMIGSRRPMTA